MMGDEVTPETEESAETVEKTELENLTGRREEEGDGGRRRDRNERKGGIQFNFLRNSLVFEIQPPKGCARG